ncbi:MAG TPA: GNAT family N-acetyltransferase [Pyrinomonadaceae bacterium]|nr:GNAT family N-acetyltransferase [Pyrinomonadaceae bacterium]
MKSSVRIASLDDAETITILINSAFRIAEGFFIEEDRINLEGVQNYFTTGRFLVTAIDDIPAACVYIEPRGERAYLGLLSVEPARQHNGLGKLLMDAAEEFCRELGCRFMDLNVVNLREELFGFYRRRGYVETGTSPFPADVVTKLPCHFIDMSKLLTT